ncbi:MAG: NAD(P)/FAD-dependent oxidoreductase [Parvibaculaceae bacterium]
MGAGIAGTATACRLAEEGHSVTLIDSHAPGWGASGRNPGFLWLQTKAAGYTMDFALAGRRYADDLAAELPDFGFRASGGMIAYRDDSLRDIAEDFARDRQAAGLPIRHIDGADARSLCPALSESIHGALWNSLDAHQDTSRLVEVLAAQAIKAGCQLRLGAPAAQLIMDGDRCTGVEFSDGEKVMAGMTIVAAGPWSNALLAPIGLAVPLVPIRFEAAQTAPAPFALGPVICGQSLFKFFNASGRTRDTLPSHGAERLNLRLGFTEQVAQFPDGTLRFGCAFEQGSFDDHATVAGQAMANAILSENITGFAELSLVRCWAGIVGQTPDGLPVIDMAPGPDGLGLNLGHFFGNLVGAFSGALCAGLLAGRAPAFDTAPLRYARFA